MENSERIKEGYISFLGYRTYYRIVNPNGTKTPLVLLHGGPGSGHDTYEVLDSLAFEDDRPIVMYDQLGCGKSSLDDPHPFLWKKETWIAELENLREKLSFKDIHLFGHSWGGMLSLLYMLEKKPDGIKSLILSSTLSSVKLWHDETHRLSRFLSKNDQEAIDEAEKTGDYSSLEFKIATENYMHMFVGGPWTDKDPECLTRKKRFGKESYLVAWGESEFAPTGNLKDYEVTDRLQEIKTPALLMSGANDESTPLQNKVMYENLGGEKKWILFFKSRHMSYVEERNQYVRELVKFLNEHD